MKTSEEDREECAKWRSLANQARELAWKLLVLDGCSVEIVEAATQVYHYLEQEACGRERLAREVLDKM